MKLWLVSDGAGGYTTYIVAADTSDRAIQLAEAEEAKTHGIAHGWSAIELPPEGQGERVVWGWAT